MRRFAWLGLTACAAILSAAATAEEIGVRYIEPDPAAGSSRAVIARATDLAYTAQIFPRDADGALTGSGDPAEQCQQALTNLATALQGASSDLDKIVKLNVYVRDEDAASGVRQALSRRFSPSALPAVTWVAGLLADADALVALDAVALAAPSGDPAARRFGHREAGQSAGAQVAVLPLAGTVYISGQAEPGGPLTATRDTLAGLERTLKHLELDWNDVVQIKGFLTPMSAAQEVRQEVLRVCGGERAAPLVLVEWISTLPIEIELVVSARQPPDDRRPPVEYLTPPWMESSPIFCRVTRTWSDRAIYVAGLHGQGEDDLARTKDVFEQLTRLTAQCGGDLQHLAKATYYVASDAASQQLNAVRPSYYDPARPPAASKAFVRGVARAGQTLTVDMIAVPAKP